MLCCATKEIKKMFSLMRKEKKTNCWLPKKCILYTLYIFTDWHAHWIFGKMRKLLVKSEKKSLKVHVIEVKD